ncbi:hypothetical protein CLOM_g21300 [Closterium sp. NIES-68]|nr:hypothetical protein CLOM_g21300 [Closterium sp. NIES-68]
MADLNAVEEGYLDVQRVEFSLVSVLNASLSQASGAAIAKGQQLLGYAFESGRCCFRLDVQLPVKHKAEATAGSRA